LIAALEANGGSGSPSPFTPAAAASSPSSSPSSGAASPVASATGFFQAPPWGVSPDSLHVDAHDDPLVDAREAYARLQFDFPELSDAQLRALADFYRRVAEGNDVQRHALPLTNALVDGVAFLAAQSGSGGDAEARGLLAAAVLLLLVARCLRQADDVRTRALLSHVCGEQQEEEPVGAATGRDDDAAATAENQEGDAHAHELLVEKFAAQEDPDDLSQVYEGSVPTAAAVARSNSSRRPLPALAPASRANGGGSGAFTDKLLVLMSRTYSSAFLGVSAATWDAWGLDGCLVELVRLLLRSESVMKSQQQQQQRQQLYGHPHGEWTRYLYVLRDRVLRFPTASRRGIRALADLVRLLQQEYQHQQQQQPQGAGLQQPHHLVYRVLAELALSKELQPRASQPAQRELAAAVHALAPLVLGELQRLGARRLAAAPAASDSFPPETADEDDDDDVALMLVQLVRFSLVASPSKRATADTLQESGLLRALLALLPAGASAAHTAAAVARRSWAAPLLRLVAECALWNAAFAEYAARVPKFSALLPALRALFPAELALLLLSFHQHALQSLAAVQALGSTDGQQLWEAFVARPLFPSACASYLESMAKLQDAVYFLECVIDALSVLRPQLVGDLRAGLQSIHSTFAQAFVYPSLSPQEASVAARNTNSNGDGDGDGDSDGDPGAHEREERGAAESLQFLALRNKLRQRVKTLQLSGGGSGGDGRHSATSAVAYSSSKLD
ncbi:hypothetical protein PybrP1_010341, partial [[Pythium] brassicae (nom. inval.)]